MCERVVEPPSLLCMFLRSVWWFPFLAVLKEDEQKTAYFGGPTLKRHPKSSFAEAYHLPGLEYPEPCRTSMDKFGCMLHVFVFSRRVEALCIRVS